MELFVNKISLNVIIEFKQIENFIVYTSIYFLNTKVCFFQHESNKKTRNLVNQTQSCNLNTWQENNSYMPAN